MTAGAAKRPAVIGERPQPCGAAKEKPLRVSLRPTARATGHPGYSQTLPCAAESAAEARKLVRVVLAAWGMDALADDGALVVTELVSNAARHAGSRRIRVTVSRPATDAAEIAVIDSSPRLPEARAAGPEEETGRGLALVDELTEDWGTESLPTGKRVWGLLTCADAR